MGIREKIGLIRAYIPADDETVEALAALLERQEALKSRYSQSVGRVDMEAVRGAIAGGRPAISAAGLWLTEEEIAEGVREVASVVSEHIESESERAGGVVRALDEGILNLRRVALAVLRGDLEEAERAAGEAGVDPRVLTSLVAWALQPALAALSDAVMGAVDLSSWSSGRCPVCGGYTALGFMDRDGAFHLKCQFCGAEWGYPSGKCPFCGNDEPRLIGSADLGEGKPLVLNICHVCGNYWKVVDERISGTSVPRSLYDLWTLVLDAVARRLVA